MDFEQGDYVNTSSNISGYFVCESKSELSYIIEIDKCSDYRKPVDHARSLDVPSDYEPVSSGYYTTRIMSDIQPHCGEAEEPCDKCARSSFTPDYMDDTAIQNAIDELEKSPGETQWEPPEFNRQWVEGQIERLEKQRKYWKNKRQNSVKHRIAEEAALIQPESVWGHVTNLTNNIMDSLKQVPKTLKRVLSDDLQKQYKAGLIDGDLEITNKGKRELWMSLQDKFSDELTESAEEIISELEDNQ